MSHKISVIIPVYNGEQFIARAIESVLAQTVKPFEIIVINDGSKDGTLNILNSYGGKIRAVSIPNGGVSNARNTGIKMAQGDCVAFLDADDVWHPNKLEQQLKAFEKYPDIGFCCCNYSIFDTYRGVTVDHFTVLKNTEANFNEPLRQLPVKLLLTVNFVGTCSGVLIRKGLLDQVGAFNVSYKQSEDYELWLRCGLKTNFILLNEVLVDKKMHTSNLTNNFKESYSFHLRVLEDIKTPFNDYFKKNSLMGDYREDISRTNYKLGELYYNEGSASDGFLFYWRGLAAHWTFKNLIHFIFVVLKKSMRLLSFGLISRKSFSKLSNGRAKSAS